MAREVIEFGRVLPGGRIDVIVVTERAGPDDRPKPLTGFEVLEPMPDSYPEKEKAR